MNRFKKIFSSAAKKMIPRQAQTGQFGRYSKSQRTEAASRIVGRRFGRALERLADR